MCDGTERASLVVVDFGIFLLFFWQHHIMKIVTFFPCKFFFFPFSPRFLFGRMEKILSTIVIFCIHFPFDTWSCCHHHLRWAIEKTVRHGPATEFGRNCGASPTLFGIPSTHSRKLKNKFIFQFTFLSMRDKENENECNYDQVRVSERWSNAAFHENLLLASMLCPLSFSRKNMTAAINRIHLFFYRFFSCSTKIISFSSFIEHFLLLFNVHVCADVW